MGDLPFISEFNNQKEKYGHGDPTATSININTLTENLLSKDIPCSLLAVFVEDTHKWNT